MKLAPEKNPSGDPESKIFLGKLSKIERFFDSHLLWNEKETSRHTKLNCTFSSFPAENQEYAWYQQGNSPQLFYERHLQKAGANPTWSGWLVVPKMGSPSPSPRWSVVPVKVTLSGQRVFAAVRWDHIGLTGWTLNPITRVLLRRHRRGETKDERPWENIGRLEWCRYKPTNIQPHPNPELSEAGRRWKSPLEPSEGDGPANALISNLWPPDQ